MPETWIEARVVLFVAWVLYHQIAFQSLWVSLYVNSAWSCIFFVRSYQQLNDYWMNFSHLSTRQSTCWLGRQVGLFLFDPQQKKQRLTHFWHVYGHIHFKYYSYFLSLLLGLTKFLPARYLVGKFHKKRFWRSSCFKTTKWFQDQRKECLQNFAWNSNKFLQIKLSLHRVTNNWLAHIRVSGFWGAIKINKISFKKVLPNFSVYIWAPSCKKYFFYNFKHKLVLMNSVMKP